MTDKEMSTDNLDGYPAPLVDPMDDLQCDSCQ